MDSNSECKNKIRNYTLLYAAYFIYSCCSTISKLASEFPFLSWQFCCLYSLEMLVLIIYAIAWQNVLKRFELSVAYANRPVTTIFSMLWGWMFFKEKVTWNMLLGTVIIVIGMWLVVTNNDVR